MIYTSLAEIKSFNPCTNGWKAILAGQKKTCADDVLFPLTEAVESNSISDVCWLLGKRKKEIQVAVKFAKMCADSVAHLKNAYVAYAAAYAAAYAYASASVAANAAEVAAEVAAGVASGVASGVAYIQQKEKNKQFLIQCITEWIGE